MTTNSTARPGAALLEPGMKGYPHGEPVRRAVELAALNWNVLAGDLPLPLAVIKREALEHNLAWMQRQVRAWGLDLAPHGKTTMSPQLFARQLDAGAWGMTFATVTQLGIGVAAGVRRALIANQVASDVDLAGIQRLRALHDDLRVVFLVDSTAQLALIEGWAERVGVAGRASRPFEVMLEVGVPGGRTGCRDEATALQLAQRLHASSAVQLVGIECYEGLAAQGRTEVDAPYAEALMSRVQALARHCEAQGWFECDEVLLSAGGSAIFDLVASGLRLALSRPVRGLLRSGCYVTHDHSHYKRLVNAVEQRLGVAPGSTLQPALEVWTMVQSCPEPGLAILTAGRRDVSFDVALPTPVARAARGSMQTTPVPASWKIIRLNDQHAHLRWEVADEAQAPRVGERVGLGIAHPCTTFDKWQWMPIVENDYRVVDAVRIHF